MKYRIKCDFCGDHYETSFFGWQNTRLCKKCFDDGRSFQLFANNQANNRREAEKKATSETHSDPSLNPSSIVSLEEKVNRVREFGDNQLKELPEEGVKRNLKTRLRFSLTKIKQLGRMGIGLDEGLLSSGGPAIRQSKRPLLETFLAVQVIAFINALVPPKSGGWIDTLLGFANFLFIAGTNFFLIWFRYRYPIVKMKHYFKGILLSLVVFFVSISVMPNTEKLPGGAYLFTLWNLCFGMMLFALTIVKIVRSTPAETETTRLRDKKRSLAFAAALLCVGVIYVSIWIPSNIKEDDPRSMDNRSATSDANKRAEVLDSTKVDDKPASASRVVPENPPKQESKEADYPFGIPKIAVYRKGVYLGMLKKDLSRICILKQSYLGGNTFDIDDHKKVDQHSKLIRVFFDGNDMLYKIIINYGGVLESPSGLSEIIKGVYGEPNVRCPESYAPFKQCWRDGSIMLNYRYQSGGYVINNHMQVILEFTDLDLERKYEEVRQQDRDVKRNEEINTGITKWLGVEPGPIYRVKYGFPICRERGDIIALSRLYGTDLSAANELFNQKKCRTVTGLAEDVYIIKAYEGITHVRMKGTKDTGWVWTNFLKEVHD